MKKSILTISTSALTALLLICDQASAQTYTETGDAGQTQGTAQASGLTQSGMIFGTLSSVNDADVFSLTITNTSTISFSTANTLTGTSGGLGGLDTELFLFTSAGVPVFANDDTDGFTLQSTLPSGNNLLASLNAGTYYIAVSLSGNDPVNSVNQLVFASDPDPKAVRGPASGTNPKNFSGFDSGAFGGPNGSYEIDVTSVPEPSSVALYLLGALLLLGLGLKRRGFFARALRAVVALAALSLVGHAMAKQDVPKNLGNGLDRLVASNAAIKQAATKGTKVTTVLGADGKKYTSQENASLATLALTEKTSGRVLVRINLNGAMKADEAKAAWTAAIPSLQITAMDPAYRGVGVMNAYVSLDDVPTLAQSRGVTSVVLELKPRHAKRGHGVGGTPGQNYPNLGTFFDQGVIQHRVDSISQYYNASAPVDYEGQGLSIACISNSFNANAGHPASIDVTNNDLPGNGSNPVGNTNPVFVLLDDLSSTSSDDEGRGMCQIVYHMAPKARVGFATANTGEVGFANAIRGLAGINSADFPNASSDGFAADVICDDVGYYDEPFYQDGIIGAGVNDVAAAGVSYFSSAANDIGVNGYESVIRVVPNDPTGSGGLTFAAGNQALKNTNVNLAGVPANLYAGGFHNFNPTGDSTKQDVAQLVNVVTSNSVPTILEWNDPYDQNKGVTLGNQIYGNSGTYVSSPVVFDSTSTPPLPAFNAGQAYVVTEKATSGTYDAIVTVIKPDGSTLLTQDTGVDETVVFTAPVSGNYKLSFDHYGTTTGSFTFTVNEASITQYVASDWNLLAFRTDTGAYVAASSLVTDNIATNEPVELGYVNRTSSSVQSIQYVLARSNTPVGRAADHIRYLLPANGLGGFGPAEYFTYNGVTTGGHAMANGCNGTAAYSPFRPNIPESFTAPGPVTVYFDANQNLLATPEVRLQPGVAATDGANVSVNEGAAGLASDSSSDYDSAANFFGTSAAAPHAAACALLVLNAHGGRHSVTPAQMTDVLHRSAFLHDLDPNSSSSSARATNGGKVTFSFTSDNSSNNGTGVNDANSLSISYTGPSNITKIVFNPLGTAATAGAVTAGNNGLDVSNNYFSNSFPGLVWTTTQKAFTVGSGSVGLTSADVTAALSNPAGPPSTTQSYTNTLTFNSNFTGGKTLKFTIARAIQHSSVLPSGTTSTNYSADLFGGGVLIPDGTVTNNGMAYSGTLADGSTFSGVMTNRIGAGYSNLDGFGFINAEAAVSLPLQ